MANKYYERHGWELVS